MDAMIQEVALIRRLYTGEGLQQARRALEANPSQDPIPAAASADQQRLEARVFLSLLELRNVYTLFPLGIRAVYPEPDCICLRIESEERAAEILFHLLPVSAPSEELHGIPGIRISRQLTSAIELRVLGRRTRIRLTGLPSTIWKRAEAATLGWWVDPDAMDLCWRSSKRSWTQAELEHQALWEDEQNPFVRAQRRGAWLGSGLLRRAGLLHTVANTFLVDGYRGGGCDLERLILRSSHVRGQGPGPHHIIDALLDPRFGLPLQLTRFRGDTDPDLARDQHFVLTDSDKTAAFELRGAVERPLSGITPQLWQAILRRLPRDGFPASTSPSFITRLCGVGSDL